VVHEPASFLLKDRCSDRVTEVRIYT